MPKTPDAGGVLEDSKHVEINQDRCKGCDLCLNLCPAKVFQETKEINKKGFKSRTPALMDKCTNCGLCQYFCPEAAISLKKPSALNKLWEQAKTKNTIPGSRGGWQKAKTRKPGKHFVSGNEACSWAALDVGCRFFAGYPITPASEQSYEMEALMPKVGGVFVQMENEDASMAALCGGTLAGVKSMTATSDPGFERMNENLSFALVNELPLVISLVQRTSPSTGRPTGTGSWMLRGVRWGPHGGTEHIVLYPTTVSEIYEYTVKAFNLSEQYRVPVILMMEASNAHLQESIVIPEEVDVFDRIYIPGEDPFGPTKTRQIPSMPKYGEGALLKVTGLTHNSKGVPSEGEPQVHENMVKHLKFKINSNVDKLTDVEEYHLDDAEIMVVAYGHTARSAKWAINEARKQNVKVGLLTLRTLYPFPEEIIQKWSKKAKVVVVPEMNQGQLYYVIRESSFAPVVSLPQMDGEAIDPRRILKYLVNVNVKDFPSSRGCASSVTIEATNWEKTDLPPIPDKNFDPQTPFCPGCGLGIVRNSLMEGIEELGLPKEKMLVVSGIGCTARLPNHLPYDSANTTHGYPVAFATGAKLAQPDLNIVVVSGDGDYFEIGAGHTIHGAQRNLPMLAICYNNYVFGMTGGQVSPTTPIGAITMTTTQGNLKQPLDLMEVILSMNVGFAARIPIGKPLILKKLIKEGLQYNGFAFIEVVSPCLTGYAKKNGLGSQAQIWQKLNQTFIEKTQIKDMSFEALKEKYLGYYPKVAEVQPQDVLKMVYGKFTSLKEYINSVPEAK